jgi:hypothetical protein
LGPFPLKLVAAVLALALAEPWGRRLPRRLLLDVRDAVGVCHEAAVSG